MRKIYLIILLLAGTCLSVSAQNRSISGKVTDDKGQALPGVSVMISGSKQGTTTNANGVYTINVSSTTKALDFSATGYTSSAVNISGKNVVNVSLAGNKLELEEVIVTGYGREKKSQYSGAASVVSIEKIETVPVGAFDQALQGRVSGMQVSSGSGQPGSSANITIRGVHSISGAFVQPLYILDGVPLPASDMQTLNANDFESITVLKDASAAALYGARGALGVIVITTKKGKLNTNNFTYRTQFGFTEPPNPSNFDMMNTQQILFYEEKAGLAGAGITSPGWLYSKKNPSYASQTPAVQARRDFLLDSLGKINTNFYDLLFRKGTSQTHDLNFSGGSDKTRFFLSAGLFDQKGTDLNSRLRRYTTRLNIDHTVGKLNVAFNNSLGYSISNLTEGEWLGNSARNPFQIVWRAKPYENPYRADGTLIYGSSTSSVPKAIGNTLEALQNAYWQDREIKIHSGLTLNFKILPSLILKNTVGIDVASSTGLRAINANSYVGSTQTFNAGFDTEGTYTSALLLNTTGLLFNKKVGKSELDAGAYFEIVRGYQKGLSFSLYNLDPRLTLTGQGAGTLPTGGAPTYPQNASSAKSGYGIRSTFATARYTYNGKYTVNANVRRDGTSRILNEANKQINTWSAGVNWNAIKEDFLKNQNFLTALTLRAAYGETPNIGSIGTGSYGLSGGLYGVTNYLGPQIPAFGTSNAFTGSTISGQVPTTPGNPELRIEYIQKANIGVDLATWKNRARLTVELYKDVTKDLFVSLPLGATTGFGGTNLPINAGTMSNKGVELSLDLDVIESKKFGVSLTFNHSININKIEDLGPVNEYPVGTGVIRKGLPYGSHYTQHYLGADVQTGKPTYEKADGTITTNISEAGLFATFGTYLPKHVGGFSANVRFDKFTVSAFFSYQFDVYRYNNVENWTTRAISGYTNAVNQNVILLTEQWEKPGDVKYYPSPLYDKGFTSSDIQDAKFLRFRNLNVSYSIPGISKNGKSIIKSAKFYVQGQNLWIWSPWRGLDPEDNNNISLNEFPNPRAIVTGLDINF